MINALTALMNTDRMLGAAFGDTAGSVYEWDNIKYKLQPEELYRSDCTFTDDTVMTVAVAIGIADALRKVGKGWLGNPQAEKAIADNVEAEMVRLGLSFPGAGYGGRFADWLEDDNRQPYGSWGNGSAMRASYAGWAADTLEEAERLAEISADVTHNCEDGENGAKVVAGCIFLLRNGASKEEIRRYTERFYPLDFTLDDIRSGYRFDVSCHGTVPYAVEAFLEAESFEETASLALSIGGDSDTLAAIACSIAEACYPVPKRAKEFVLSRLHPALCRDLAESIEYLRAV